MLMFYNYTFPNNSQVSSLRWRFQNQQRWNYAILQYFSGIVSGHYATRIISTVMPAPQQFWRHGIEILKHVPFLRSLIFLTWTHSYSEDQGVSPRKEICLLSLKMGWGRWEKDLTDWIISITYAKLVVGDYHTASTICRVYDEFKS